MTDKRPNAYWEEGRIIVRASAFGSCTTSLVALLQGHEQSPIPEPVQERFDASAEWEPVVLSAMAGDTGKALGIKRLLMRSQAEGELRLGKVTVRSHCDEMVECKDGTTRIVEVKALANDLFFEAVSKGVGALFDYADQMAVMMRTHHLPGVWVIVNKDTGNYHVEWVDTPPRTLGDLLTRAKQIEKGVEGELRFPCDKRTYPCPVFYLHPEAETEIIAVGGEEENDIDHWSREYTEADVVVQQGKVAQRLRDEARDKLVALVGERRAVATTRFKVVKVTPRRTSFDRAKAEADLGRGLDEWYVTKDSTPYVQVEEL